MYRSGFIIGFVFWWNLGFAQHTIQWQKAFGGSYTEEALHSIQATDGSFLVVGKTASTDGDIFGNHGSLDYWILKLNSQGNIIWKKLLGGSINDIARSIIETQDGGFIVAGYSSSNDFDVVGNHGGAFDGWIVKINKFGIKEWAKAIGGSKRDMIHSVKATADNGCIVVGKTDSSDGDISVSKGKLDVWVVKMDVQGEIEWEKSFGGSENDESSSVVECLDGGFLVVGETFSYDGDVSGQHGNGDFWVLKLRPNGDLEWQKTLGGDGSDFGTYGIETTDGDYVITGYVGSHNSGDVTSSHDQLGSFDYWVVRLDKDGDIKWQKTAGGTGPDWARQLVESPQGGYIIAGTTGSIDGDVTFNHGPTDFWVIKVSAEGELQWQKTYGGSQSDDCYSIAATNDNGYILAGYTWSTDGDATGANYHGSSDFWIVKLSPETTSATPEPETSAMSISPNPCGSSIMVQLPENATSTALCLTDLNGRTVFTTTLKSSHERLDVGHIPRGVYFLRVGQWIELLFKTN